MMKPPVQQSDLERFFWISVGCLGLVAAFEILDAAAEMPRLDWKSSYALYKLVLLPVICGLLICMKRENRQRYDDAARQLRHHFENARKDSLTGALSRSEFLASLNERLVAIRHAQMHGGRAKGFTLAILDVDNFKTINDTFGHQAGDGVLQMVVQMAAQQPDWCIGRLGGDEFGIILPSDEALAAADMLGRFAQVLGHAYKSRAMNCGYQGVSIGYAVAPQHGTTERDLLQAADMALYASKSSGKGLVNGFQIDYLKNFNSERHLMRELKAALLLNDLDVHYQPITNDEGAILGAEALVRWRHDVMGQVSPGKFIPIAERYGLIGQLTEWVMKQVCDDYPKLGLPYISVNLSGVLLANRSFIDGLYAIVRSRGCEPSNFLLEVTETAMIDGSATAIRHLEMMRSDGFRVALDDFGTGHCHFTQLRNLPVDVIKIDKSYIQRLDADKVAQVFVAAVNEIARTFEIRIVAEGVETREHLEMARSSGATQFQGYLRGRPVPIQDFISSYLLPAREYVRIYDACA